MSTSIQSKTVRPGGLRYTYYQSGVKGKPEAVTKSPKKGHFKSMLIILVLIAAAPIIYAAANKNITTAGTSNQNNKISQTPAVTKPSSSQNQAATAAAPNACASNQLSQLVIVSISKRHLWACNTTTQVYDSAVVTGDEQYADTLTPTGTYHIYAKETNRTLTGSAENGSWNDYVYYWMPFLYNQYGAYGFHDATWRQDTAFGNIDPNSSNASNGCVELPLATAKWIYNWSVVGTTVTIEN